MLMAGEVGRPRPAYHIQVGIRAREYDRHAVNSAGWDGEVFNGSHQPAPSLLYACLRDWGKRGPNPLGLHKHGRADHTRLMHVPRAQFVGG